MKEFYFERLAVWKEARAFTKNIYVPVVHYRIATDAQIFTHYYKRNRKVMQLIECEVFKNL